jgi:hypothetical protein
MHKCFETLHVQHDRITISCWHHVNVNVVRKKGNKWEGQTCQIHSAGSAEDKLWLLSEFLGKTICHLRLVAYSECEEGLAVCFWMSWKSCVLQLRCSEPEAFCNAFTMQKY